MIKILKNPGVTDVVIDDMGEVVIPSSGQRELDPVHAGNWMRSDDTASYILSEILVMNDGSVDLSPIAGERYLRSLYSVNVELNSEIKEQVVNNINFKSPFLVTKSGDGVVDVDVDGGYLNNRIFCIGYSQTGSSGDKWLSLQAEDHYSNEINFRFPFSCKLIGIQYTNKKNNTKFILKIYKALNGSGSSDSLLYQWTQNSSCRNATKRQGLTSAVFSLGDKMGVFMAKNGSTEPDTPVVTLWFQITDSPETDTSENYSGDF